MAVRCQRSSSLLQSVGFGQPQRRGSLNRLSRNTIRVNRRWTSIGFSFVRIGAITCHYFLRVCRSHSQRRGSRVRTGHMSPDACQWRTTFGDQMVPSPYRQQIASREELLHFYADVLHPAPLPTLSVALGAISISNRANPPNIAMSQTVGKVRKPDLTITSPPLNCPG